MNSQTPVQKFEAWCIVELFGHQQLAGLVTERSIGPAVFLCISVPETSTQPAFDRMLNPSAIYALNPVTEDVARARAEQIKYAPVTTWDVKQMLEKHQLKTLTIPRPNNDDPDFLR